VSGLKQNIIANYASQIYVAIIGIVLLPMYLKYMGVVAWLVSFLDENDVVVGNVHGVVTR